MKTTVLLKDQTVGETFGPVKEGDTVEVILRDENGNKIRKTGIIEEILQECADYMD